jgi:signal transduction histidine kinase/CheY-like chemotaxis protein
MQWFRDLKTRTKLFLGFGLLTFLVVSAGLVGYQGLKAMRGYLVAMDDDNLRGIFRLTEIRSKLNTVRADLLHMVGTEDRGVWLGLDLEIARLSQQIDDNFNDMLAEAGGEDVRRRIMEVRVAWWQFRTVRDEQLLPALYAGRLHEARRLATGAQAVRYRAYTGEVSRLLDHLIAEARAQAQRFREEGQRRYAIAVAGFVGLSGLAVFLGIALAFLYNRVMAQPLVSLVGVLERVAAGDLTVSVEARSRDEMGQVAQATRQMVERLRKVVSQTVQHERLRALGEVAAGVAHEFNNLLAVTLGQAELLLVDDSARREGLEAIRRAALDGRETVRRLQHFTGSRYLDEQSVQVDPCQAVEEVIAFAAPKWKYQAQACGVTYQITKDFAAVPSVQVPPSVLREVLLNLLINALEAMPHGGRIRFRVWADHQHVLVAVSDSGAGIPEAIRMHIFNPFFTTKPAPASGLGLSICSRIMTDLRGTLAVESEPGRGTTFIIRLPLSSAVEDAAPSRPSAGRALPKRSSILVIDDEPRVAETLAQLLRQAGHEVETVADGSAGIERYRGGRFDCVIIDLVMPGLTGLTVGRAIKDHDPDAYVVLLTGWGEQVGANESAAAGVGRIIMKPVSREQLFEMFETGDPGVREFAREASCPRS